MKLLNAAESVCRYILAGVSCVSIAEFLLLVGVGTEHAARLAGQSLGRGILTGAAALVWFYQAKKRRTAGPAVLAERPRPNLPEPEQLKLPGLASPTPLMSFIESEIVWLIVMAAGMIVVITLYFSVK